MENFQELKPVGRISPFTRFCCTIGNLPTSYMISLTYEEQLLWLCQYLEKTVIPAINTNAEAVAEVQKLYNQLKEYVDNYFDNLDVQEEINNKLDEMAESGELTEIIAQYLELAGILAYNTVADMKNADNLAEGSFTKTYGKETYNDGYGEFYKIRTLLNTDIIDNENIIALVNYPTLIAEKMPNAKINNLQSQINNLEKYFNLKLQPNFYYDDTQVVNLQGSCVDENNILYVYNQNNYPYGDVLKFNIATKQYIGKISNVKFYHGNDMTCINNKLYVASCQGETTSQKNRKIVIYDLLNDTIEEINPFDNYETLNDYISLIGISYIDNDNILCVLTQGGETFNELLFTIYNLQSEEITIINKTNNKGLRTDFYTVFQACEYIDGNIYVMTTATNSILNFKLINNIANLESIFNIPYYDNLGVSVGENEGLCKIPTNYYGEGTLMITSQLKNNELAGLRSLHSNLINIYSNLPTFQKPRWVNDYANANILIYVNNSDNNTLYEDGSQDYPFKDIGRAIECVSNNKEYNLRTIRITGGDNYYLGRIIGKRFALDLYGRTVNIIGDYEFRGCRVCFITDSTGKIVFKGTNGAIDNSDCTFVYVKFEGKIQTNNGCIVRMNSCELSGSNQRALVLGKTLCYLGASYSGNLAQPIMYGDFSTVILPDTTLVSKIIQSGASSVLIKPRNS